MADALQLPHNRNNAVTRGVWRGADGLVHKVLTSRRTDAPAQWASSTEPWHWNYWRREADVYESRLPERLGLGAPALLASRTLPDGDVELVLADVAGTHGGDLSIADIAAVAFSLGRSQGADPLPSEPWFSRGFLADYSTTRPADFALLQDEKAWALPLIAKHFPPDLRAALVRMHRNRDRLLDLMLRLPRTVCHLDVWPNNVIRRADGEVVLLDWAFLGDGAVGEDAGNLVPDSFFDWPLRPGFAEHLPEAVTEAYLAGLDAAGWRGDRRLAVLGMRAAAVKYDWLMPWCLKAAMADEHRAYGSGERVDPDVRYQARAAGLAICARWADEAMELAESLGL
ncbi:phosphotransferase [Catenulispora subtropica]|uniref:Aminoglycoside phosphotransferase n=1 Tax=Catenulispora subtropica TaxID=450798 RepID=A0ABP5C716_9ACTN